MELTRQGYGIVILAAGLALLAVTLSSQLLLGGTAGLIVWLLAKQWQFVRAVTQTTAGLTIDYTIARDNVTVEESTGVSVVVACDVPTTLSMAVQTTPPLGTTGPSASGRTVTLDPDSTSGETSYTVTAPTAGQHRFEPAAVTIEDQAGFFQTSLNVGDGPTLTAEPRQPDDLHVGEGGEQLGAFGAFRADQHGEGVDPAELREYVPGDSADRIDWNATARLGDPHVLEFEVDTDRRTVLVVDHRSSVDTGPVGERAFDYLRQAALAFLAAASRRDQATGLLTVGDDGITNRFRPATGENHYARIRQTLFSLEPGNARQARLQTPTGATVQRRSPATATNNTALLADDNSAFARSLRPFFADIDPYVRRIEERPLYETIRTEIAQMQGTVVTMLLTDDDQPTEIREAIDVATRGENRVATFLAPSVLFEQGGFTDLSAAYDRYVTFETFRRELAGLPRAEAYEVAPEARIEALLAAPRGGQQR
ncbi:DUF58 domain-containing protein [Salinibaculum salinum]|uniref:DUF58 domain-containing protein n=1 Tax=Salinibaculum salinum TaxID=3131996 RepID=UPI0030ED9137